jgi:hypothetical protein
VDEGDRADDCKTSNNASPGIWRLYRADEDKEDGDKVYKVVEEDGEDVDKAYRAVEVDEVDEGDEGVEEVEGVEEDHRSTAR